jgi:hypothetical protein
MRQEDDQTPPESVRRGMREYNHPPQLSAAETDAMWSAIEKDAFPARFRSPSGSGVSQKQPRSEWLSARTLLPLAAVLVLGVAIGRFGFPRKAAPASVAVRPANADSVAVPDLYQSTTSRYLGQTAALLVSLPAEVRSGRTDARFMNRAHDLLLTTRLLLDSPAAADPRFRTLLEDLELVLAQVVRMPSDQSPAELDLIRQALEQRDVLPRLRSAVADISADD